LGTWNWRYSPLLIVGLYVVIIPSSFSYFKESLPKLVAQEVKEPSGAIKASILTKRVIILLGVFFFVFLVHTMLSSSLSLMIYARFTQSSLAIGSLNIFSGISLMIFSVVLIKPITKRVAEQKIVVFSIGMLIGFFLAYPFVTEFWMLFVLFIPFSLAMTFLFPIITTRLTTLVSSDRQGEISGWSTTIQYSSDTVAPLIATAYLDLKTIVIMGFVFTSYMLIGFTSVLILLVVLGIIIRESKYYRKNVPAATSTSGETLKPVIPSDKVKESILPNA
jgi:MFS family permease